MSPLRRARAALAQLAASRAARLGDGTLGARRWLRAACALEPVFGAPHRALLRAELSAGDPLNAMALASRWATRFDTVSDAWVTLGEASAAAYRIRDALVAYERALQLEERADAAFAAGTLYRRIGDPATAGARFARAYAAGAGPEALLENARALLAAGDRTAAAQAIRMWEGETGRRWKEDGTSGEPPAVGG
jgi:tetratricopeptide (TPR) repeat protein